MCDFLIISFKHLVSEDNAEKLVVCGVCVSALKVKISPSGIMAGEKKKVFRRIGYCEKALKQNWWH